MEFSNNEVGEQLNIWLKATFINDVLKIIAEEDPDATHLFNGFEKVIINGGTAELRVTPYGDNVGRGNTKDGYHYKDYVNYYLIPKEMGAYKTTVQEFTTTMLKLLRSPHFFSMMTVYQNSRTNTGGRLGIVLRDANAEIWTQLRKEDNYRVNFINSLNAKFMNDTILMILHQMFEGDSVQARYQQFGWRDKTSNPFYNSKIKK
jgi:hypothetical protein